jgi:hypothetical protein
MGSSPSAPTDLRPSPATPPYHKNAECFYLRQWAGILRGLIQAPVNGLPRSHQLGMSALVVCANTREARESPDPADEETGPRLAKLDGACCKEVGSAPQILATLPLSYRNTDRAAPPFTPRPEATQAPYVCSLGSVLLQRSI